MKPFLPLAASFACIAISAKAHEFWIDPQAHMVAPGEQVVADIRVGQKYEGSRYSYIPKNFRRFDYAMGGDVRPVEGRVGDRPALTLTPDGEGLLVVIHESTDLIVVWDTWDRFKNFLEHKDLEWGLAEHDARGLPRAPVRERYSRYAKSLIAVGNGAGEDFEAGLLTEIVALENPYTGEMSDGMDIRVLYQGKPRSDTQVEVFDKAPDGTVTISYERTDETGEATIPVTPGHRYQLDAVVLRPLEVIKEKDPSWESLWANMTLEVPAG